MVFAESKYVYIFHEVHGVVVWNEHQACGSSSVVTSVRHTTRHELEHLLSITRGFGSHLIIHAFSPSSISLGSPCVCVALMLQS